MLEANPGIPFHNVPMLSEMMEEDKYLSSLLSRREEEP
jgi:hypothetical protein